MIKQISWPEYFTVLGIGLLIYYSIVIFLYYRSDLVQLFSGSRKLDYANRPTEAAPLINVDHENALVQDNEEIFSLANRLIEELKDIFRSGYIREELMMAIQLKLREYPTVKSTPFKISINNYIEQENEKRPIRLSEEDLRALW